MPRIKDPIERDGDTESNFSSRLQEARAQLDLLREQQDLIEREKNQLEELKGLTEELENDKRNVSERLSSAISLLEKKEHELRVSQQEVLAAKNELENAADEIQISENKSAKIEDVREKVSFEKHAVESAKSVLARTSAKIEAVQDDEYEFDEDEEAEAGKDLFDFSGFMDGFKSGVGFFAAGLAAAIIFYVITLVAGR